MNSAKGPFRKACGGTRFRFFSSAMVRFGAAPAVVRSYKQRLDQLNYMLKKPGCASVIVQMNLDPELQAGGLKPKLPVPHKPDLSGEASRSKSCRLDLTNSGGWGSDPLVSGLA